MATGQQRRPGRRALRLDVEVQKLQPLGSEPVDPRCGRAAQHAAPIAAELTPAEVVPVEEHDVRSFGHHPSFQSAPAVRKASSTSSWAYPSLLVDLGTSAIIVGSRPW